MELKATQVSAGKMLVEIEEERQIRVDVAHGVGVFATLHEILEHFK